MSLHTKIEPRIKEAVDTDYRMSIDNLAAELKQTIDRKRRYRVLGQTLSPACKYRGQSESCEAVFAGGSHAPST